MLRSFTFALGALAVLWAAALATPVRAQAPGDETRWYIIVSDAGETLGHASVTPVPRGEGRDVVEEQELYIREQDSPAAHVNTRTVRSEDASGRTLAIRSTTRRGRYEAHAEARIQESSAELTRDTPSGRTTQSVPLPPGTQFDEGEALLRNWDPQAAPRLDFPYFNIDASGVERVVIEVAGPRDAEGRITAVRTRYQGEGLRGIGRVIIDREGRIVELVQPMFGSAIHVRATDQATAQASHRPYRVVPNFMTRSPYEITSTSMFGRMRYRFSFRDGLEFALPETGEQRAHTEGGFATVEICDECGPGMASDEATLADALRPTAWLQSDDHRIRAIAEPVARMDISDVRKMELLVERARPYFPREDYSGHYSAVDTILRRAGDCTEAAVLVAALGRAAGIPTRVASGLAYSRESYHGVSNAFMPHSWVLAWADGRWRSYDMALDRFDSTHIVLTIGDGDARSIAAAGSLASSLRFDALAEVRTRH